MRSSCLAAGWQYERQQACRARSHEISSDDLLGGVALYSSRSAKLIRIVSRCASTPCLWSQPSNSLTQSIFFHGFRSRTGFPRAQQVHRVMLFKYVCSAHYDRRRIASVLRVKPYAYRLVCHGKSAGPSLSTCFAASFAPWLPERKHRRLPAPLFAKRRTQPLTQAFCPPVRQGHCAECISFKDCEAAP